MKPLGNVLITGGASGLGAATARAVAEEGGSPLVLDIAAPEIDAPHVRADLADREATEEAVHELVRKAGGRLDSVFTAAGVDSCGPIDSVPAEEWDRVVRVNLLGTAAVVRTALPYLKQSRGAVVTCSSTLGLKAVPDATAYCASKFGVLGFSRALAAETAGSVGVTTLVPGGMHTAFFDGRDEQYKPPADAKLNRPEDVARTVLFALRQPAGCEVREMVVCSSEEGSWP
ncbi:NADP-dependent 3-hydroxy acid dehydrogenase YdfG [Saccharopolyspora erythraea NRRL 2338]|uniref:Short-chain dehydrogenase/reductase SDR n=2 Tax=Saccharopolyspora erythraea TaxID=1836 RepID=A4FL29_SACEN|nr:SDR family oxidoreductase [Saccharopolyspora erythraea]EQD82407.1 short-chain dehydrogenase [Saccharopolyspora erythraea D]PFG98394.1 NADP-dependent 3-hydroxy acid dehydrogenase YdfG [Saccharopolyspora erythraea NRRL 2338]QRK88463.1 SDR family oxidoreductase [Saccharopolyspora erythraea]CAM04754.1 short-chain dehydrogenase/reductase SDR [Saccharopolyspora erythraea NRRL 2338]